MRGITDYVVIHCRNIYGMRILYRNRVLYVKTSDDTYSCDFSLAKHCIYCFHSMTKPFVLTETCLARGFFRLAAHESYKKANKIPTNSDWEKFLNDAYKHTIMMEENNV